jgi:RNA polymerase sigma-70 factor, ECF subfamily
MNSTSVNLLKRLREPHAEEAWQRFIDLYTPLIYYWVRQRGLGRDDSSDLVQDVMLTLIVKLSEFEYDASQRFRGWLRTVTVNRTIDFQRRSPQTPAESLHSSTAATVSDDHGFLSDIAYQRLLVQRTLKLIRPEFHDSTWQAAWMQLIDGQSASAVASQLGISLNRVYLAKSRALARLREELEGLLD